MKTQNIKKGGSPVQDKMIVELYWQRDEIAIQETEREDSKEGVKHHSCLSGS